MIYSERLTEFLLKNPLLGAIPTAVIGVLALWSAFSNIFDQIDEVELVSTSGKLLHVESIYSRNGRGGRSLRTLLLDLSSLDEPLRYGSSFQNIEKIEKELELNTRLEVLYDPKDQQIYKITAEDRVIQTLEKTLHGQTNNGVLAIILSIFFFGTSWYFAYIYRQKRRSQSS